MRIQVHPADQFAVGHYRAVWPAQAARAAGMDVALVPAGEGGWVSAVDRGGSVAQAWLREPADVLVVQRPTSRRLAQAIPHLRAGGTAVVVDVDDDLACLDPRNPAYAAHHPRRDGDDNWNWLKVACREASLVTVSTPALLKRFAPHGRGVVIENRVPRAVTLLEGPVDDEGTLPWAGWAGSRHSHPGDLEVVGDAVRRSGLPFRTVGDPVGVGEALGLGPVEGTGPLQLSDWHRATLARVRVGIAPLAQTKFNVAKSWLKPLEYAALGIPWVGSDTPEYARFQRDTLSGFTAGRPASWLSLLNLLKDPRRRRDLSLSGREAVRDRHTVEGGAHLWCEAWQLAGEYGR